MTEVKVKKGESIDKALRRLKRKLDREGTLREARLRKAFEKPCNRRRRKAKEARLKLYSSLY
ncbi:30S ribosomal protein S21 [Candidatus Methylacidiphilum infernorum]|uniref:Small ribosomal subunit protein bS21 n=1 Tax=Methylacidiphilum infernorum (isolate V4) TaxID=481448 RepID=RS21_METI4|nr:30S ribosomal protein S21 [Candidatus Methylacidiphilum infernorum]B3DXV4.1 RecName: Full=Small ribosomal subunit protein bS21; AltName: Full=30S ribosomal protein S21 [Methylacidiphilum infernorum V4]ACD83906.1 Ribosomal protein S21 [Methylacidiphilum infernorum V4]